MNPPPRNTPGLGGKPSSISNTRRGKEKKEKNPSRKRKGRNTSPAFAGSTSSISIAPKKGGGEKKKSLKS